MQGSEIAAYAATGALGLFTLIKGISHIIRGWNGDRKEDKADKSVGHQLDLLEKENKDLREENTRLRDDWKKLAKEEAALSAEIQSLKVQVKEQNERISNLSRLIVHLVRVQGKDLPPEVVLSIIAPMAENETKE